MLHRLCEPPSIPLSFSLATLLPRRGTEQIPYGRENVAVPSPRAHRLQLGLPGYLILFAPPAFVPQRQKPPSEAPSPPAFPQISTHFTATPGVPLTPAVLEPDSIERTSPVEPGAFTLDLPSRLRTLYAQ